MISEAKKLSLPIFFYCKHEDRARNSLTAVLRGFLAQLIHLNPEILTYIHDECSKTSELTLETLEFLKRLVGYAMEGSKTMWMILDGLDECEKKEKKKILTWATDMVENEEHIGRLRLLIVSQDEGDVRKSIRGRPTISLNEARVAPCMRKLFGLLLRKKLRNSKANLNFHHFSRIK